MSPDSSWKIIAEVSVVEVVEDVGLTTCQRMVYRHGAILLIVRECSGFNPRR